MTKAVKRLIAAALAAALLAFAAGGMRLFVHAWR